jgi:5-hydroxyisourate hydrolase-like protein (transthyretin family)
MPVRNIITICLTIIAIISIGCCNNNSDNSAFKWTVRGRVVGPKDQPVPDVPVYAYNGSGYQTCSESPSKVIPWKRLAEQYPTPSYFFCVQARTGNNGEFHITLKSPVNGLVMVRHPDYLQVEKYIEPSRLTTDNTLDMGIIALDSGASVIGIVTGAGGKPAGQFDVGLCRQDEFYDRYIRFTKTDKEGRYTFKGLPNGKYAMAAWNTDSIPCEKEIEIAKSTSPAVLDFAISGEKGRSVKVLVRNRYTGQPIPFCQVQITLLTDHWPNPVIDAKIANIVGAAEFTAIPESKCLIVAIPPDQMQFINSIRPHPPFSPYYRFFGDEQTVTIKIDPPITVKGRILDANTSQPVRAFHIIALPDGTTFDKEYRETYGMPYETNTGAITSTSGSFVIDRLRAGKWHLQIRADSYEVTKDFPVDIPVGGLKDKLDVPIKPATGKISGTVLDAGTGQPLAGIRVHAYEWDPRLFGVNSIYAITDGKGVFAFNNLISDEFSLTISAEKEGYVRATVKYEPGQRPAVLEPLRIEYVCTLRGVYLDANGQPVPGAKIILAKGEGQGKTYHLPQVITKADGSFEITNIPKGEYFIHYHKNKEKVVFTKPGQVVNVVLK